MAKLFNKSDLKIEHNTKHSTKTLLLSQKRNDDKFYMNTIIDEMDNDWNFTRSEAEALYRHLGGMLAKEESNTDN
jgi:hypothetical protein